jgi:hypothetical protein
VSQPGGIEKAQPAAIDASDEAPRFQVPKDAARHLTTRSDQSIIRDYLQEVEDYLEGLLAAAGYRDSRSLAAKLHTLVAGAIALAVAGGTGDWVDAARDAAVSLVAGASTA